MKRHFSASSFHVAVLIRAVTRRLKWVRWGLALTLLAGARHGRVVRVVDIALELEMGVILGFLAVATLHATVQEGEEDEATDKADANDSADDNGDGPLAFGGGGVVITLGQLCQGGLRKCAKHEHHSNEAVVGW